MSQLVRLAWRNIWRNRRRTVLTLLAIGVGLGLTLFTRGLQLGTYQLTIDYNVSLSVGHIQIHRDGYWEHQDLSNSFEAAEVDTARIAALPEVMAVSPKLVVDALVAVGDAESSAARLQGVLPRHESALSVVPDNMVEGEWLRPGDQRGAVIGQTLAGNLSATVGDTLVYFTQGRYGSTCAGLYTIRGIFSAGERQMDAFTVFVPLHALQPQVSMDGRWSALAVRLADYRDVEQVISQLRSWHGHERWEIMDYQELMPGLMQTIAFDNASGAVFLILLIVVIGFGILETILMSVMERYHEFGVMLAVGLRRARLAALIFTEALALGLIGTLFGNLMGYGLNTWFQTHPIAFGGETGQAYKELGFVPKLITLPDMTEQAIWTGVVLGLTLLAALWPAHVATRFRPAEALSQV